MNGPLVRLTCGGPPTSGIAGEAPDRSHLRTASVPEEGLESARRPPNTYEPIASMFFPTTCIVVWKSRRYGRSPSRRHRSPDRSSVRTVVPRTRVACI
jgi:hypothetical protein